MDQPALSIDTEKIGTDAVIIKLRGNLTGQGTLLQVWEEGLGEGIRHSVLNLDGVRHVTPEGVCELTKLYVKSKRAKSELMVAPLSPEMGKLFALTGLAKAIPIYSREAQTAPASTGVFAAAGKGKVSGKAGGRNKEQRTGWATPVSSMVMQGAPSTAIDKNVTGRRPVGAIEGFGQLWEKTYKLRIEGTRVQPAELIRALKQQFTKLQPPQNRFYASNGGMRPGEVILINASTPGGPVATGVLVSYSDEESFMFMTPQGHPESGWVIFSSYTEGGATVCQIHSLARANDPIYEVAFLFGGSALQERIWTHVLTSLARHLGTEGHVQVDKEVLDPGFQWGQSKNVWYNAQVRTMLYYPVLALARLLKRSPK